MRSLCTLAIALLVSSCSGDDASGSSSSGGSVDAGSSGTIPDAGSSGSSGSSGAPADAGPIAPGWQRAFASGAVAISCSMTEAQMTSASAPSVAIGTSRIFVGYVQAASNNQNAVVARFDGGQQKWCESHETQGPDGRALGLSWDGGATTWVVYTVDGGGSAFDAAGAGKWLPSYGQGGGPKVTFVGSVDASTGKLSFGSFVRAQLQNGNTNTHTPTDAPLVRADGNIEIRGSSAFQPLNPDKSIMTCTSYPFDTRYVFAPDLSTLVCSSSTNCTAKVSCP